VVGTVVGLAQYRLKRLLAFSTISHVGFLLLALAVYSEESITSFLFYLMQYSLTNVNAFFIVLALGYLIHNNAVEKSVTGTPQKIEDITYISQLKGQFYANPILGLSLALCLFSMAGIPPLVGFFC
jgi:NADH-ubiquinone oxidoreductase chain 2